MTSPNQHLTGIIKLLDAAHEEWPSEGFDYDKMILLYSNDKEICVGCGDVVDKCSTMNTDPLCEPCKKIGNDLRDTDRKAYENRS